MRADDFISCPDHLLSSAIAYGEWLESRGYRVAIEPFKLEYPNTPQFRAKRHKETLFVEVMDQPDWDRITGWIRYCKACSTETRFIAAFIRDRPLTLEEQQRLTELGVGAVVLSGAAVMETVATKDLALHAEPPSLPPGLKSKLGHAYDQLNRGEWREGFEEACLALEQEARAYLKKNVGSRIQIVNSRGVVANPTAAAIGTMTLGTLADKFAAIKAPNQVDSRVGEALKRINKDRISVVHYRNVSASREAALRKRFGKNMMVLVNAMKMLKGIK